MKRFVPALFFALLMMATLGAAQAQALMLSGFLAQCTAVGTGTCTEQTGTAYARQPISFSNLASGVASQAIPYTYAQGVTGNIAGHAVYDALTGGNLLIVIPYAATTAIPSIGDRGDVGSLKITVPAAAGFPAEGLNATYQAAATLGTTPDGSTVSTGIALQFQHGNAFPFYGTADATTRQVTQVTAFTYAVPPGVSAVNIKGAGTLATGTVTLPIPLADGTLFRLSCSITITALTVTPGAGSTMIGTAPTTCGANASHELQYFAADTTWHVLF